MLKLSFVFNSGSVICWNIENTKYEREILGSNGGGCGDITLCSLVKVACPDDRGRTRLWNIGLIEGDYIVLYHIFLRIRNFLQITHWMLFTIYHFQTLGPYDHLKLYLTILT
jgi:hypothetical protein